MAPIYGPDAGKGGDGIYLVFFVWLNIAIDVAT